MPPKRPLLLRRIPRYGHRVQRGDDPQAAVGCPDPAAAERRVANDLAQVVDGPGGRGLAEDLSEVEQGAGDGLRR
jgi:hypothetical protein